MTNFEYKRHLHHYETDADGVCHFSNYLRIFEEALEFSLLHLGFAKVKATHGFAVVSLQADYTHPLRAGDIFTAKINFPRVKRSFIEVHVSIKAGVNCCARVKATLAAIDRTTNKSVSLAPLLREQITTLIMEHP